MAGAVAAPGKASGVRFADDRLPDKAVRKPSLAKLWQRVWKRGEAPHPKIKACHPEPEGCSWRWVAHAPPRVVFGALAENPCLAAAHGTVSRSVPLARCPARAPATTRGGRVRYPFFVLRLHRSG